MDACEGVCVWMLGRGCVCVWLREEIERDGDGLVFVERYHRESQCQLTCVRYLF